MSHRKDRGIMRRPNPSGGVVVGGLLLLGLGAAGVLYAVTRKAAPIAVANPGSLRLSKTAPPPAKRAPAARPPADNKRTAPTGQANRPGADAVPGRSQLRTRAESGA